MKIIARYLAIYGIWIGDIVLALWLMFISRTAFLTILAVSGPSNFQFPYQVGFADKAFSIFLGLGWLAFMIGSETYFRSGIDAKDLPKRLALVTAIVLLCIFVVDMLLVWLQGTGGSALRWFLLAVELGGGIGLLILAKPMFIVKSK